MYRISQESGPTTHVYSGTEYDAFAVGEYRLVRSFCPRRHRYVLDYAAPIVPMRVAPANPDASMRRERLPTEQPGGNTAQSTYSATLAERNREREDAIITAIEEAGAPILLSEAAAAAGIARETLVNMLLQVDTIHKLTRSATRVYVGLPHHTLADCPRTFIEQRIIDALRALGEATQEELMRYYDVNPRSAHMRMKDYPHLVEARSERRPGNGGRQVYTVYVYRLREDI